MKTNTAILSIVLAAALGSSALARNAAAQDLFVPADLGVADYEYKVSEGDFNFKRSLAKAPVNEWAYQTDFSRVDTQQVIRENQDVVYASAVVDVSEGATFTVPEGPVYHVIQIIDLQNYIIDVIYPGESRTVTPDDLTYGNHVFLNQRIAAFPEDEGGIDAALKHREGATIEAASAKPYETPDIVVSPELLEKVRLSIIADIEAGKVPDNSVVNGTPYNTTPEGHLFGTAYGWGGLGLEDAAYMPIAMKARSENGNPVPSSVTFEAPELDAARNGFWSVTTYNDEGWLAEDKAAISNTEAVPNDDGTYTINFNSPGSPNNLTTPSPFTALLRVYAPASEESIKSYMAGPGAKLVIK